MLCVLGLAVWLFEGPLAVQHLQHDEHTKNLARAEARAENRLRQLENTYIAEVPQSTLVVVALSLLSLSTTCHKLDQRTVENQHELAVLHVQVMRTTHAGSPGPAALASNPPPSYVVPQRLRLHSGRRALGPGESVREQQTIMAAWHPIGAGASCKA